MLPSQQCDGSSSKCLPCNSSVENSCSATFGGAADGVVSKLQCVNDGSGNGFCRYLRGDTKPTQSRENEWCVPEDQKGGVPGNDGFRLRLKDHKCGSDLKCDENLKHHRGSQCTKARKTCTNTAGCANEGEVCHKGLCKSIVKSTRLCHGSQGTCVSCNKDSDCSDSDFAKDASDPHVRNNARNFACVNDGKAGVSGVCRDKNKASAIDEWCSAGDSDTGHTCAEGLRCRKHDSFGTGECVRKVCGTEFCRHPKSCERDSEPRPLTQREIDNGLQGFDLDGDRIISDGEFSRAGYRYDERAQNRDFGNDRRFDTYYIDHHFFEEQSKQLPDTDILRGIATECRRQAAKDCDAADVPGGSSCGSDDRNDHKPMCYAYTKVSLTRSDGDSTTPVHVVKQLMGKFGTKDDVSGLEARDCRCTDECVAKGLTSGCMHSELDPDTKVCVHYNRAVCQPGIGADGECWQYAGDKTIPNGEGGTVDDRAPIRSAGTMKCPADNSVRKYKLANCRTAVRDAPPTLPGSALLFETPTAAGAAPAPADDLTAIITGLAVTLGIVLVLFAWYIIRHPSAMGRKVPGRSKRGYTELSPGPVPRLNLTPISGGLAAPRGDEPLSSRPSLNP